MLAVAVGLLGSTATTSAKLRPSRATQYPHAGLTVPATTNNLDCNGWSAKYKSARPAMKALCTDPVHVNAAGHTSRLIDNGWYVGHDEPSVKFISSTSGSGNTMTYYMQLPVDPVAAPTASGSVTNYGELSIAPWFGLPLCDPNSYPQNPCTPDSDTNSGAVNVSTAAGSAFMELQFYPPGFTPFIDGTSCSATQWCSAVNIDSLECNYGFATCNTSCQEPVNFAFLQTDGIPSGPASPQLSNVNTLLPNGKTLMMNPGDVLQVSITDPAAGFTTTVTDLSTGQTGFMTASAGNGFKNTSISNCAGNAFTFHAEYDTAKAQNRVPWAALEGGVLMEQEIGHFEPCTSLANKETYSTSYAGGSTFSDPNVYQNCVGGPEGANATGEGPCAGNICSSSTTQGPTGPAACPTNNSASGTLCEFSDGFCLPQGQRTATVSSTPTTETSLLNGCLQNQFQNGDLDFDGTPYQTNAWPNGSSSTPTSFRYAGPFTSSGAAYPQVQFESNVGGSSALCNTSTGAGCAVGPLGAKFYPFWSLNYAQTLAGAGQPAGSCVWNFGNDIAGVTNNDFSQVGQYGSPDLTSYGGTSISAVLTNPATLSGCGAPTASVLPTISGTAQQGQILTGSHATWSNGSTAYTDQWADCDSSGNSCAPISGANGPTYTPTGSDVGSTIRLQESVPGGSGMTGRAASTPTAVVIPAAPAVVSPPTISGNTTQGQTLTELHGTWANNPTSFSYQWEDCNSLGTACTPISGATDQTYVLTSTDVGGAIVVQETAHSASGASSPASSAPTGLVQSPAPPATKPRNTAPPKIFGTARVGAKLSASTGLWSGTPPIAYTYRWQVCAPVCVPIAGARHSTFTAPQADFDRRIAVVVTASNGAGSTSATSAELGPIGPSVAQIQALLRKLLAPRGSKAKTPALLARGGYPFSFKTPSGGRLVVDWYAKGATPIATASARFTRAGTVKAKVALTRAGMLRLMGSRHVRLTTKGTFTPTKLPSTTVKKKIKLAG